jgi:electron transfer flavoprotein beta subunit
MMDILVCFKVGPDLDMLSGSDWVIDDDFQVDTRFAPTILNPGDEGALELALKLRDAAQKEKTAVKLTALTIGTNRSNKVLKNLYSLQYDQVVRVECQLDLRFNARLVSGVIHQYLNKHKNHQVIIMGSQSSEGDNAKTPLLVAERQGIPCVTSVTGIQLSAQTDRLAITSKIDDLIVEQIIKPPVVLVIGNVPNSYLRIPTLKDKLHYGKKEIAVYSLGDLDMKESAADAENDCELIALFYERQEKNCVFLERAEPSQQAAVLYEDYLRERVKP